MRDDNVCLYTLSCKLDSLLNKMFHEHKSTCDVLNEKKKSSTPPPLPRHHSIRFIPFPPCVGVWVVLYSCNVDNSVVKICTAFHGIFSLPAHCAACYVTPPINHRPVHWRTRLVSTNNERVVLVRLHWPDGLSIPNLVTSYNTQK
jgi:hypothetical protein